MFRRCWLVHTLYNFTVESYLQCKVALLPLGLLLALAHHPLPLLILHIRIYREEGGIGAMWGDGRQCRVLGWRMAARSWVGNFRMII